MNLPFKPSDSYCLLAGVFGLMGGLRWIRERFKGEHWLAICQYPGFFFLLGRFLVPAGLYCFLSSDVVTGTSKLVEAPSWLKAIAFGGSFELILHSRFHFKMNDPEAGKGPFDLVLWMQNYCLTFIGDRVQASRKHHVDGVMDKIKEKGITFEELTERLERSTDVLLEETERIELNEIIGEHRSHLTELDKLGHQERLHKDHALSHHLLTVLRVRVNNYASWQLLTSEFLKKTSVKK